MIVGYRAGCHVHTCRHVPFASRPSSTHRSRITPHATASPLTRYISVQGLEVDYRVHDDDRKVIVLRVHNFQIDNMDPAAEYVANNQDGAVSCMHACMHTMLRANTTFQRQ